ncbi:MAG: hypothetical protein AMR96_02180 [Candidatus Adiutrix intracellularis]|nr:MAG: hypothetical protein AMR96_02180 [Candidatus Adiutrix intracellularis]
MILAKKTAESRIKIAAPLLLVGYSAMAGVSAEVGVVPPAGVSVRALGVTTGSLAGVLPLTEVSAGGGLLGGWTVSDHFFPLPEVLWGSISLG